MSKFFIVSLFISASLITNCSRTVNPKITVTANYTGSHIVTEANAINVDFFYYSADIGNYSSSTYYDGFLIPTASGSASSMFDSDTYYVIAYYDADGNQMISSGDTYTIYNNQTLKENATPLILSDDTSITLNFDDANTWL